MAFGWDSDQRAFAEEHIWGVLATGRVDGSPQQSMIGYFVDDEGRIVISAKAHTAKWKNAVRQRRVSLTVPDGRVHLVVYGDAETISEDPVRAELTAKIFGILSGGEAPDPESIVPMLDEQERTIIRITPTKTMYQD